MTLPLRDRQSERAKRYRNTGTRWADLNGAYGNKRLVDVPPRFRAQWLKKHGLKMPSGVGT